MFIKCMKMMKTMEMKTMMMTKMILMTTAGTRTALADGIPSTTATSVSDFVVSVVRCVVLTGTTAHQHKRNSLLPSSHVKN